MKLKKLRIKPSRLVKRLVAVAVPFIILLGAGMITNLIILRNAYSGLDFLRISAFAPVMYVFALAFLSFLIFELNRKIPNSSVAIGLVLAFVISLPYLLFQFSFAVPASITVWNVVNNFFSIILASYVFYMLYS